MARFGSRLLVCVVAVVMVAAIGGGRADAHALRESSSPDAGTSVPTPPADVRVTFTEQPDPGLSSLKVLDSSGRDHATGKATPVAGEPQTLRVGLGDMATGVYTVSWRTLSEVDGHPATGSFSFGVGVKPTGLAASAGAVRSPGPSVLSVAERWLLYAGLMVLVGGSIVMLCCFAAVSHRRFLLLLVAGVAAALVSAVGLCLDQLNSTGVELTRLFDSPFGRQLLARAVPLGFAVVAICYAFDAKKPSARRLAVGAAALAGAVGMWGDVSSSHAAAAQALRPGRMILQWVHFMAAGIWVGGLAALLVGVFSLAPEARRRAVGRFSTLALGAVVLIAGTGALQAIDEVGSLSDLVDTTFGRLVLLKAGLLTLIIVLGAVNRYRSIPRVEGSLQPLRSVGIAELGLVAVVLVATGLLQGLAPPASVATAKTATPLTVTGHDFGTTVRVRLSARPGFAGFNEFGVAINDYDTSAPVEADGVSLRFRLPSRPDIGESTLALPRSGPGTYQASGANLSINGTWNVTILLERAGGGTEIPLSVTTRQQPQRLEVQRNKGIPDIYTVHLVDGRSVQSYLDPGKVGTHFNEFHATFLGADGQELAVRDASVTVTAPGQKKGVPLVVRRLDPAGHFVADLVDAVKGAYRFQITGTLEGGDLVEVRLESPVR